MRRTAPALGLCVVTTLLIPTSGAAPEAGTPWAAGLRQVDHALGRGSVAAAVRAWHDADVQALESRRWEGLVEVADAYLRIGQASGFAAPSRQKARQLYLAALFRARAAGDLDGVLRVADAFAVLGDRDVVTQCLVVARDLAARGDASARYRVDQFEQRPVRAAMGGAGAHR